MADTTDSTLVAPHDTAADTATALHDAERDTRHGLAHLEDEFLVEWRKMATYSETEAKKLLAWLASKV